MVSCDVQAEAHDVISTGGPANGRVGFKEQARLVELHESILYHFPLDCVNRVFFPSPYLFPKEYDFLCSIMDYEWA
jgi:hypothetical protein